jgi:hypothetical protein
MALSAYGDLSIKSVDTHVCNIENNINDTPVDWNVWYESDQFKFRQNSSTTGIFYNLLRSTITVTGNRNILAINK